MRNASLLFLLLLSCLALGQAESPQLRKEIQRVYADLDGAINRGDFAAAFGLLDPSFVAVDADGKTMNFKEFKAMVHSMKPVMKNMKSHITVQQVQGNSQEAFAWITMRHSYSLKEGNTWKKYDMTDKFVETLKRAPTGWKITYSQVQPKQ